MVDVSNYKFKPITDKAVKQEESFINLYVDKCLESENTISSTRWMRRILDAKYKKADLIKVMTKQCQHLNDEGHKKIMILFRTSKICLKVNWVHKIPLQ